VKPLEVLRVGGCVGEADEVQAGGVEGRGWGGVVHCVGDGLEGEGKGEVW
jgi:hypothetical protein